MTDRCERKINDLLLVVSLTEHHKCPHYIPHDIRYYQFFFISRHFSLLEKKEEEFLQYRKLTKLNVLYTFDMLKN